jgi:hypothetical protein
MAEACPKDGCRFKRARFGIVGGHIGRVPEAQASPNCVDNRIGERSGLGRVFAHHGFGDHKPLQRWRRPRRYRCGSSTGCRPRRRHSPSSPPETPTSPESTTIAPRSHRSSLVGCTSREDDTGWSSARGISLIDQAAQQTAHLSAVRAGGRVLSQIAVLKSVNSQNRLITGLNYSLTRYLRSPPRILPLPTNWQGVPCSKRPEYERFSTRRADWLRSSACGPSQPREHSGCHHASSIRALH